MRAGYAPLPTQQPNWEADRELDEAFDSDGGEEQSNSETTPLAHSIPPVPAAEPSKVASAVSGAYDFERDYDYDRPPPGSPPRPSAVALPNNFGNSNGLPPSSPVATAIPRPSFFRRAVGAILPTHYTRLPTNGVSHPAAIGGGTQNDGVFANVTAKPSRPIQVRTDDGNVYMVPEEVQSSAPPSYAAAQADAVPPYWETTVHAPMGLDTESGMIIDDLPSGSIISFIVNVFTSFFFQFVGFLLTYLLHTTHAAKFGSRAGLGLTLIQYGFYSRAGEDGFEMPVSEPSGNQGVSDPTYLTTSPPPADTTPPDNVILNITSREWMSFLLMTLGWFLLLSSLIGFWRVKHWESSIRASNAGGPSTPTEIERDMATRRHLDGTLRMSSHEGIGAILMPTQPELEEARLRQDLRAAGLL
ncbi:hypothetical protein PAXRUDRAFT_33101 [Paxillus rubicundulus Ve08.2h10]|uniref:Metal homeostatis protein bsd2 n=1 Tax=Paxillus rubicundulus Ve08.2h10 TaxID=930991 RepID=A0A0D0DR10_9AGAM|nr:hypothetical protein PAXRUDRAFT_33101 [Paxillus rubicundulus Ve08.2h10]